MKMPDKIYLPKKEIEERRPWIETPYEDDPDWDECYIRKDALLGWLEALKAQSLELREAGYGDVFYCAQIAILEETIDKIDSL